MTAVSGAYDQAALDAQFKLDTVADLDGLFARRAAASEAALARFACQRAMRYRPGPGHRLNLFPAEGAHAPAPVQVFIHGGFWRSLDADLFSFVAAGFVPFGAAAAIIDYPLMPAVRMAEVVEACRSAIWFLHGRADDLGLDPSRIFISGNSAGGHLVAELLDARSGVGGGIVKGGCAISGLYDLEPVGRSFQNESLALTAAEVAGFSPLARRYRPSAPIIATVGGDETQEFLNQNAAFAAKLGNAGTHRVEPGLNHISVVLDGLADPAHPLNQAVRAQMGVG